MAAKLTRLTHKIDTTALSGRRLYHLQFSLQAASPETFGYIFVFLFFPIRFISTYFAYCHFLFLHSDPLHTKELQAQATHELSNSLK
jgi:hypothetical protein